MEALRDSAFDVLSDEEAWNLFREMVGDVVDNANLHDIAKEVAKECGGLPIAILTLGKALAKREKSEWENTILQLKKCIGVHEKVQSSITLSYNFLGSVCPQAQPLLLLCCLFLKNENIPIEHLIKYSMGLKLFDDVATFEETRNKVYKLINLLKNCNLLLDGDQDGENGDVCVKVHDIVLDACLLIASHSQHSYLVRHERNLKLWPEDNRWKTLTAVVLTSDIMDELPAGLDYPNLRLLQLQLNGENIDISEDFFQGMKALSVFSFQGNTDKYGRKKVDFALLPPSLQSLSNLRALSLEFCKVGGDIFLIGCLKRLEVLSFFKSYLDKLPSELRELRNLKLLDLRCDNANLKIGDNVLSSLENLEVLYMGKYESWMSNGEAGKNARITELELLSCLTTLQIKVPNSRILLQLKDLFFEKLKRFEISIDWGSYCCGRNGIVRNSLCLGDVDLSLLSDTRMHSIVGSTQCLELEGCDEVQFIIDALDLERGVFHNLESLVIEEMSNLIEICRDGTIPDGSFHSLQKLRLAMLPAMRHLWRGPLQPPSLINLRVLDMSDCHVIESLFSPSVAKCLMQLEELKIGFCFEVEGVICNKGREDEESIEKIQFPKLSYLWLEHLPKLKSFYLESSTENVEDDDCGTTLPLFNQQVSFPSLDKMEIQDLNILKQIVDSQLQEVPDNKLRVLVVVNCEKLINLVNSTAMLQNLEEVVIDNCESVEAVFDLEGPKAKGEPAPSLVYKLERIQLIELPRLTHVWRTLSKGIQGFQNLKTISIYYCHELRYLVSVSMAKVLVNLQVLNLAWCNGMLGVIEGEDEDGCGELESTDNIVFHQLQVLRLEYLSSFTSFSSSTHDLEFPLLNSIKIKGCPNLKFFCRRAVSPPILKDPVEDSDGKQWIWEGNLNNGFYREKRYAYCTSSNIGFKEEKEVEKEEVEVKNKVEIESNDRTKNIEID